MNHIESQSYNYTYNLLKDMLLKLTSPISVIDAGIKEVKTLWRGLDRSRHQNHTGVNPPANSDRVNIWDEEIYDIFKHTSDGAPCRSLTAPNIDSVSVVNGNKLYIRWSNASGLEYRIVYYRAGESLLTATTTDTFYQTTDLSPGFYTVMVEACDHSGNGVFSMPFTCMIPSN